MYLGMCIYSYLPDFQYADAFSELVEPMTMEYITQFQKLSKELSKSGHIYLSYLTRWNKIQTNHSDI